MMSKQKETSNTAAQPDAPRTKACSNVQLCFYPKVPHSRDSDTPLKSPTQMKYKSTCIK